MEQDTRVDELTVAEREMLVSAAGVLDRLERVLPDNVLFDSCDQYYVTFATAAERLRVLAGSG